MCTEAGEPKHREISSWQRQQATENEPGRMDPIKMFGSTHSHDFFLSKACLMIACGSISWAVFPIRRDLLLVFSFARL